MTEDKENIKRKRSDSETDDIVSKKKTSTTITIKQTPEEEAKAKFYFQSHVFDEKHQQDLQDSVKDSKPYKWGTITNLIDDQLLRNVRKEIMSEIQFTKKETDIYKVYQSGDLANLSGLSSDELSRLPSLYKLRSAIYSQTFRDLVSRVTGCGKLSGIKTDMSLNTYIKGCHLLTHDDVIGSRRVSFILYMPEPGKTWKPHYGGSLRLFDSVVPNVPQSDVYCKLTPQFNQIAFFRVQPGLSFHDVEEVRVDKQRLSIQGWFHIPQKGEDGYIPGEQESTEALSTLQQLETKELKEYDFPKTNLAEISDSDVKQYDVSDNSDLALSKQDIEYLSQVINPQLLTKETMGKLNDIFAEESVVDIFSFLNSEYESLLKDQMKHLELNEMPTMPQNQEEVKFPWKLAVPPHKQRYLYMDGLNEQKISTAEDIYKTNQVSAQELPNFGLTAKLFESLERNATKTSEDDDNGLEVYKKLALLAKLMRSISFKKWLALITGLVVVRDQVFVRRFRPGHDFILATKIDDCDTEKYLDAVLEATLNLTPTTGWESGELGGYELCMNGDDDDEEEDDDKDSEDNENLETEKSTGKVLDIMNNEDEAAIYKSSSNDESVLYTSQACWNKLCLTLRDSSVLKFVKYVSFNAPGSRWDISGSWNIKNTGDEEEGDEESD